MLNAFGIIVMIVLHDFPRIHESDVAHNLTYMSHSRIGSFNFTMSGKKENTFVLIDTDQQSLISSNLKIEGRTTMCTVIADGPKSRAEIWRIFPTILEHKFSRRTLLKRYGIYGISC